MDRYNTCTCYQAHACTRGLYSMQGLIQEVRRREYRRTPGCPFQNLGLCCTFTIFLHYIFFKQHYFYVKVCGCGIITVPRPLFVNFWYFYPYLYVQAGAREEKERTSRNYRKIK